MLKRSQQGNLKLLLLFVGIHFFFKFLYEITSELS